MVALMRVIVVVGGSLALPLVCMASGPIEHDAVRNCARAEAQRLDAQLAGTQDRLASPLAGQEQWDQGSDQNQMVVVAHDQRGRQVAQMLCTYDRDGQVIDLRPAGSTTLALDLDR
jgi:hypothetical protein